MSRCEDPENAHDSFPPLKTEITNAINIAEEFGCPRPCKTVSYETKVCPSSSKAFLGEDGMHSVFIYYPNNFIRVDSTYLLMDFATLVSGLGGLLGLYLGLSCFAIFNHGISMLGFVSRP